MTLLTLIKKFLWKRNCEKHGFTCKNCGCEYCPDHPKNDGTWEEMLAGLNIFKQLYR